MDKKVETLTFGLDPSSYWFYCNIWKHRWVSGHKLLKWHDSCYIQIDILIFRERKTHLKTKGRQNNSLTEHQKKNSMNLNFWMFYGFIAFSMYIF